tara:strand:+ start:119 stop:223 length:105 start_codon:yes stop_codon:yes gene_type:complete
VGLAADIALNCSEKQLEPGYQKIPNLNYQNSSGS